MRWPARVALSLALVGCGSDVTDPHTPDDPEPPCDVKDVVLADGSCLSPGVPADGCGVGFVHDGDRGCSPVLPETPCPEGWLAVPGDPTCRQHPCGEGTWGDVVTGPDTQHVDGTYPGSDSDGTATKPWTTVQHAVDAATPGAVVAVAAGSYEGDVELIGKPVTLWGRCPSMVELVGVGVEPATVMIREGADGAVVRGLALRGSSRALGLSGSQNVRYEQLWIHDAVRGLEANDTIGPASFEMTDVLVENVVGIGLLLSSTDGRLTGVAVRDVLVSDADAGVGRGLSLQRSPNGGATATVEVIGSLVRRTRSVAVRAEGVSLSIEDSVILDTVPQSGLGIGVEAESDEGLPTTLSLARSLVSGCTDVGVLVDGSSARIEATVVRGTRPSPGTLAFGRGVNAQYDLDGASATLDMVDSLVEDNHDLGVVISGSTAAILTTAVRGTLARASDMLFGDNVVVADGDGATNIFASMTVDRCLVTDGARAGLASFGAELSVGSTRLSCHDFDLTADDYAGSDGTVTDAGDNLCGCPTPESACQIATVGLQPPGSPLPPD